MLRQYDQAADVATTLLKTSHYSTEADVQQSRERAATVLVQAFEEQSRCAAVHFARFCTGAPGSVALNEQFLSMQGH